MITSVVIRMSLVCLRLIYHFLKFFIFSNFSPNNYVEHGTILSAYITLFFSCKFGASFLPNHLFSDMLLQPETFTLRIWFIAPSAIVGKVKKFTQEQATKA
jgi:hypothetical protein